MRLPLQAPWQGVTGSVDLLVYDLLAYKLDQQELATCSIRPWCSNPLECVLPESGMCALHPPFARGAHWPTAAQNDIQAAAS